MAVSIAITVKYSLKGIWWMPRHKTTMKDVGACEKPRGGGNQPVIRGCPNGVTRLAKSQSSYAEYIGVRRTPGELKHLSNQRKRNKGQIARLMGRRETNYQCAIWHIP